MLPALLSEQLCSLRGGVERLAVSVIWTLVGPPGTCFFVDADAALDQHHSAFLPLPNPTLRTSLLSFTKEPRPAAQVHCVWRMCGLAAPSSAPATSCTTTRPRWVGGHLALY